jgi:hypothetical protein
MNAATLLELLVELYPEFGPRWNSVDNLFRNGSEYTVHGVCAEFSGFFVELETPLEFRSAEKLFSNIEEVLASDPMDTDATANALCTCFLENIAQTEVGESSAQFMGTATRSYFEPLHDA